MAGIREHLALYIVPIAAAVVGVAALAGYTQYKFYATQAEGVVERRAQDLLVQTQRAVARVVADGSVKPTAIPADSDRRLNAELRAPIEDALRALANDSGATLFVMLRDATLVAAARYGDPMGGRAQSEQERLLRVGSALSEPLVAPAAAAVLEVLSGPVPASSMFVRLGDAAERIYVTASIVALGELPNLVIGTVVSGGEIGRGARRAAMLAAAFTGLAAVLIAALAIVVIWQLKSSFIDERVRRVALPRTDESSTLAKLNARVATLAAIAERSGDAVLTADAAGQIDFANGAFERLTGFKGEAVRGLSLRDIRICDTHGEPLDDAIGALRQQGRLRAFLESTGKSGQPLRADITLSAVTTTAGELTGYVAVLRDAAERAQREADIHYLAKHDALTRLPNRVALLERLQALMRGESREPGRPWRHAVLYLDLDGVQAVHARLGQSAADQLLSGCAERLMKALRADDMVARVSGAEFVALLADIGEPARAVAFARKIIATVEAPLPVEGQPLRVAASIGVAVFPDHGIEAFHLIKLADSAMRIAKQQGGHRVALCQGRGIAERQAGPRPVEATPAEAAQVPSVPKEMTPLLSQVEPRAAARPVDRRSDPTSPLVDTASYFFTTREG